MSNYYRVDFNIANNEDLRQDFAVRDGGGAPIDLDGSNLKMDVEGPSGLRVIQATLANGQITVTDAAQGHFRLAIPAATLRALPEGSYRHDFLLVRGAETKRLWVGTITINRGVTI